jgi:hypothetical protein
MLKLINSVHKAVHQLMEVLANAVEHAERVGAAQSSQELKALRSMLGIYLPDSKIEATADLLMVRLSLQDRWLSMLTADILACELAVGQWKQVHIVCMPGLIAWWAGDERSLRMRELYRMSVCFKNSGDYVWIQIQAYVVFSRFLM